MNNIKVIECEKGGERLDVYLASNLSELTRNMAQKLLSAEKVTLSGKVLTKNHRTVEGEIYEVTFEEPESLDTLPQNLELHIVFEDADLIVVDKPKGMVVHPAPGHPDGTLVNALLYHCGDSLSGVGGAKRPGIVHRIDKDTSGLVIAAKNDKAHMSLTEQLQARTLTRQYEAIACGILKNDEGSIDAPIGRHPTDRKRQAVTDKNSRTAITHYEVIERFSLHSYVRCKLETGRTHQIRVHLAYIGYPILGDVVYGRKKAELGQTSQCLHAKNLKLLHPRTGVEMELTSDLPSYFEDILCKIKNIT
ncbi:MAG: RluA family pseudouridine synthase [Oscillospiraceae bacterium]|nr:RluA family pseudouridine synthase [Oscillospiraceae bacterium]MCL2249627.1 RluA family pseudouridine synthase [Oscillospiraceae bacterium]